MSRDKAPSRHTSSARVGRIVLLFACAVALVVPAVLLADAIAYIPLVAAVLLVVVSWGYLQILRRSLAIDAGQANLVCVRGDTAPLTVVLQNRCPLPFPRIEVEFFVTDLFGEVDDVRCITCALGPHETQRLDFGVAFPHVGTYQAGVRQVIVSDLLGLLDARFEDGERGSITVRPRRIDMGEARDFSAVADDSRSALKPVAADDVDYASVREYRFGDSMKSVHWNLSARDPQGGLFTRLYEAYVNPTVAIVIDSFAPDLSDEELMSLFDGMVEAVVSLCLLAREAGVEAEVRYIGSDGEPASMHIAGLADADNLIGAMRHIARASDNAAGVQLCEEVLRESVLGSVGAGNVALVTSRNDAALLDVLVEAASRRCQSMAYVAVPRTLEGKERERFCAPMRRLDEVGAAYWAVESNEVMSEVCAL